METYRAPWEAKLAKPPWANVRLLALFVDDAWKHYVSTHRDHYSYSDHQNAKAHERFSFTYAWTKCNGSDEGTLFVVNPVLQASCRGGSPYECVLTLYDIPFMKIFPFNRPGKGHPSFFTSARIQEGRLSWCCIRVDAISSDSLGLWLTDNNIAARTARNHGAVNRDT